MAKSLRSKRKRKLRAEKRIVNAKKELVKLKSIVSNFNKSSAGAAGIDIVNFKGDKKAKMVSGKLITSISPLTSNSTYQMKLDTYSHSFLPSSYFQGTPNYRRNLWKLIKTVPNKQKQLVVKLKWSKTRTAKVNRICL